MNKVQLLGRLTKDPEVRYTEKENPLAIARYSLAVPKRNRDEQPNFINCVAFGKSGEFAEKYFKKGQQVCVVGSLNVSSWEDENGKKKYKTEVNIEEQFFAGGKNEGE